jgi:hypothetical protein
MHATREGTAVVVKLSATLYLITGLAAISHIGEFRTNAERVLAIISALLCLAMGIGLFMKSNWARWLALGPSLLTWTLGTIAVLGLAALFLKHAFFAAPVVLVIGGAYIWLNFKLFDHLISDAGRAEFRTPETERHAVVKSSALQIVLMVAGAYVSGSQVGEWGRVVRGDESASWGREMRAGANAPDPAAATAQSMHDEQPAPVLETAPAPATAGGLSDHVLRDVETEARGRYFRRDRELRLRRSNDPSYTDAQYRADRARNQEEFDAVLRALAPAAAATTATTDTPAAATESEEETPSSEILKCRDSSGATTFTQGYCPAGTTPVP